ncbi:hypothetical protein RJ639_035293 [Escallonia herrerae]|uniref:Uncharacterized protein n=1 Tax=Escallonia herrerae TaxID=1293975 RepID=A0AA88WPW1_9ASTE|nr:hypothetical protein RJ639_035293 [Escallonia herrerae]
MPIRSAAGDRARAVWRARLGSAFRTGLACGVVGCTTLYGPAHLRSQLPFAAFSYVTTILIVSDATLGDTLKGCWHAFYATIQVLPPSILTLWVVGPDRFSVWGAALAVAVTAFFVALPESTHLLTKRIAFGQLVIVYVGAVIHGERTGTLMHPLHVAASTALGALASVLAMLLPYPRLATFEMNPSSFVPRLTSTFSAANTFSAQRIDSNDRIEKGKKAHSDVRKLFQSYTEIASERTNLYVKAFLAQDSQTGIDMISRTKPIAETGAKLLQSIELVQGGVLLERPRIRDLKHDILNPGARLQEMETSMRGMEIALTSCPSFPLDMMDQELTNILLHAGVQLGLKLEQAKCFLPNDVMTVPETKEELLDKSLRCLTRISPTKKDLPAFFFLFCIQLLLTDSNITRNQDSTLYDSQIPNTEEMRNTHQKAQFSFRRSYDVSSLIPSNEGLAFAFKCSLSLGLAVLFGLIYTRENGYWSGLTIAITFATGRQPTFTFSNARAQGTAMGSVYGVLCCFVLPRFTEARFLLLLPWIIFTSFLRHSRMYGQAGGISAVIGALLILGRKNYGAPDEFAIARLAEAFIGLFCMIMVELLLQPRRAATIAKSRLSQSIGTLQLCIQQIVLFSSQKENPSSTIMALRAQQKKLKSLVNDLENLSKYAEMEPDFWFLPFRASCYSKVQVSLSKMVALLHFMAYIMESLQQTSEKFGDAGKQIEEHMNNDVELFKETLNAALKSLEITSIKSLKVFKKEWQDDKIHDLESGSLPFHVSATCDDVVEKILSSFLHNQKKVTEKILADEEELKGRMVLCLGSLGFCISRLLGETKEIEQGIKELVQWENPLSHIH